MWSPVQWAGWYSVTIGWPLICSARVMASRRLTLACQRANHVFHPAGLGIPPAHLPFGHARHWRRTGTRLRPGSDHPHRPARDHTHPRSGRRFFLFPALVTDAGPAEVADTIVKEAGKALVLAPDTDTAVATARELAQPGWPVFTIDQVADGMEPFAAAPHAVCGLAARYDGLDLPGDTCHAVVLNGKPDADNLQERFLSQNVRAGAALAERLRTRVVQGAGRCTRGPNDWAIVVVLGSDLTTYLVRPETRQTLDPELQSEISFGIDNSRGTTAADMLANVRIFLAQSDEWR